MKFVQLFYQVGCVKKKKNPEGVLPVWRRKGEKKGCAQPEI